MLKKLGSLAILPYFRISHVEMLLPHLKKQSLYQQMSRWIRQGKVVQLKNGYYVMKEYADKNKSQDAYIYYVANMLRQPSYVTGVTVLRQYDILTELTYPITSVTTKSTRTYTNVLGDFVYSSVAPLLYTGYERRLFREEPIYVATKAKALFDYLYSKYSTLRVTAEEIKERERLNLENVTRREQQEFARYCGLSRRSFFTHLSRLLFL